MRLTLCVSPRLAITTGLWLAVVAVVPPGVHASAPGMPPGLETGQQAGGLPQDRDEPGLTRPTERRPLDGTALVLGGLLIGHVELHRQKPLPNTAPTHEEMKAVTTPPEFRTPPAISFGWSWKNRR